MEQDEKVRENRLRRMADRQGLRIEKSRRRDPRAIDFGLWTVTYKDIDESPGDAAPMTLERLERWLEDRPRRFDRIRTMVESSEPHALIESAYLSFTDRGVAADPEGNLQDSGDALDVAIRQLIDKLQGNANAATIFNELGKVESLAAMRLFAAHLTMTLFQVMEDTGTEF